MGKGLSYLKNRAQLLLKYKDIELNYCWNYGPSKLLLHMKRNHLLIANIFKLHEYQTFDLMKMHNRWKIWVANKIFSLFRWNKKYFSWFSKGFQLPEIILRLQLYWSSKGDFCVISQKILTAAILWDIVARNFSYYWTAELQNVFR